MGEGTTKHNTCVIASTTAFVQPHKGGVTLTLAIPVHGPPIGTIALVLITVKLQ